MKNNHRIWAITSGSKHWGLPIRHWLSKRERECVHVKLLYLHPYFTVPLLPVVPWWPSPSYLIIYVIVGAIFVCCIFALKAVSDL